MIRVHPALASLLGTLGAGIFYAISKARLSRGNAKHLAALRAALRLISMHLVDRMLSFYLKHNPGCVEYADRVRLKHLEELGLGVAGHNSEDERAGAAPVATVVS